MMEYETEPEPYLPIEVIILEGLDAAISKGWISLQEKIDWIDAYNASRNAPVIHNVSNITDPV